MQVPSSFGKPPPLKRRNTEESQCSCSFSETPQFSEHRASASGNAHWKSFSAKARGGGEERNGMKRNVKERAGKRRKGKRTGERKRGTSGERRRKEERGGERERERESAKCNTILWQRLEPTRMRWGRWPSAHDKFGNKGSKCAGVQRCNATLPLSLG